MTHSVRPAEFYVLAEASIADGGRWLGDLLRPILAVVDGASVEIIDERQVSIDGDIASAVVKIATKVPEAKLMELVDILKAALAGRVVLRLVLVIPPSPSSAPLNLAECALEYFRREFAIDSHMVHHGDSCVKLVHISTGLTVRSTIHRSRLQNEREAVLALEALLSHES